MPRVRNRVLQPVVADPWRHTSLGGASLALPLLLKEPTSGSNGLVFVGILVYHGISVYPLKSLLFQPFQTYPIKCLWGSCELSPATPM